jgi:hypothetical protein
MQASLALSAIVRPKPDMLIQPTAALHQGRDRSCIVSAGSLSQGQFAALLRDVRIRSPRKRQGG